MCSNSMGHIGYTPLGNLTNELCSPPEYILHMVSLVSDVCVCYDANIYVCTYMYNVHVCVYMYMPVLFVSLPTSYLSHSSLLSHLFFSLLYPLPFFLLLLHCQWAWRSVCLLTAHPSTHGTVGYYVLFHVSLMVELSLQNQVCRFMA